MRGAKASPAGVIFVAAVLVALVVAAVICLLRKPAIAPQSAGDAGASHAVVTPPRVEPKARPAPASTPVTASPQDPASYLRLLDADPANVPPDQQELATALKRAALAISKSPDGYIAAVQQVNQNIFEPLNTAESKDELEKIRAAGEDLHGEVQKARDFYAGLKASLTGDLVRVGLTPALAEQIAARFIQRAQSRRAPVYDAVDNLASDAIRCVDALENSRDEWRRGSDGKLSFRSKPVLERFSHASEQLRNDLTQVNQALPQFR